MVFFSTGSDSPVNTDSSTRRFDDLIMRMSAGTFSPSESTTMSPGTSLLVLISVLRPALMVLADEADCLFRFLRTLSVENLWI